MADSTKNGQFSDNELVALALKNPESFGYIIERYREQLLRYILRISNVGPDEAQDLLQEVFIKVYKNLNSFDSHLKFSSWLYRIARNHVISHHRKSNSRPKLINGEASDEILRNIASDFDINKQIDLFFLKNKINEVFAEIAPKYKEVLILKFLEDKSYQEISDILKKPMGSVATLVSRAKIQFRQKLQQLYGKQ